jgi:hypothetical protein
MRELILIISSPSETWLFVGFAAIISIDIIWNIIKAWNDYKDLS